MNNDTLKSAVHEDEDTPHHVSATRRLFFNISQVYTEHDFTQGGRCSEETVSTGVTTPMKATGGESGEVDKAETKGEANDAAVPLCNNTEEDVQKAGEVGTEATVAAVETDGAKAADSQRDGKIVDKAGIGGNSGDVEGTATFDNQTEGEGIAAEMSGTEPVDVKLEGGMPCVVTEIRVVTFGEGEKVGQRSYCARALQILHQKYALYAPTGYRCLCGYREPCASCMSRTPPSVVRMHI